MQEVRVEVNLDLVKRDLTPAQAQAAVQRILAEHLPTYIALQRVQVVR